MTLLKKIFSVRKYSFMLLQLVKRDFKVRYRGSVLGMLWSVLNPLLNMIVLSIVFSQVFRAIDNYKMYLLSGLVVFNFFSEATNVAISSVVNNFGLMTKVYFPKFILPLSKVLSSTINLLISLTVFIILGSFMEVNIWWGYLLIVYMLLCLLLFTTGVSFILSAMQVFMRDVQHLYSVLIIIWMYSTPILYPIDIIPKGFMPIFKANPMYNYINFFRDITLHSTIPDLNSFIICFLWGIGMFIIGSIAFVKSQSKFIYYT